MSATESRRIVSAQQGPDERLAARLQRQSLRPFSKPIASHTISAVDWLLPQLNRQQALILDSGCGTGESTSQLAADWPEHQVLGLDRSAHRLGKAGWSEPGLVRRNLILLRVDLVDCWRLLLARGVRPERHYLLYPNPYPKPSQLGRRWHAHPVFPSLIGLGGRLELRTNWEIYAQEFALALELTAKIAVRIRSIAPPRALSAFEAKYHSSGHQLFQVVADLQKGPP